MKNTLKTTLLALGTACMLCSNTYASPAFKTVGELCEYLLSTASGDIKTEYELPKAITSPEQWKNEISAATSVLTNSVTLNIKDFDEDEYSLSAISDYNISISAEGTVRRDISTITYNFTYSPNYRIMRAVEDSSLRAVLTSEELAALMRAYAITDEIITPDMTDYEKELAIHDYIISNYQYDVAALKNPQNNVLRTHSITGMLIDGKGVCEAYSNTFMLLCRISGLNCTLATGTLDGTKHQWNIIELNGEYYNVDLTSDDPVPDKQGRTRYGYFNLSDSELAKTHIADDNNTKCTGERYNYYSYNNLTVSGREDLLLLLNDKLDRGIRDITFKTRGGYTLYDSSDLKAVAADRGLYNITVNGEYGKEGVFNVTFS